MIRNDRDIGIVARVWGMQPYGDSLLCDVFNTETGDGIRPAKVKVGVDGVAPRFVVVPQQYSKDDILEAFNISSESVSREEKTYLKSTARQIDKARREVLDVFGHNGILGLFRVWMKERVGSKLVTSNSWPTPMVQRKPEIN